MKRITIIFSLLFVFAFSLADTHIPAGNVNGVWTIDGSPYIIDGEISIQQGDELTIEPGIQVIFSGHYKFNIYGRILAEGTATDSIVFIAQDAEIGWHSLRFWNTNSNGQDSSRVVYCELRLGKATGEGNEKYGGAIYCNNSSDILIRDCLITKNYAESHGGGIHFSNSSPSLINVTITGNYVIGEWTTYGGGISCTSNSNPSLENVTISSNIAHYGAQAYGGGIYCSNSNPILANVTISGNNVEGYDTYGAGIYCTESNPSLVDVTITGNYNDSSTGRGGGIYCNNNSSPSLEDVVINGNYAHYGGGICCSSNSNPTLENVTITENDGMDCGGGIYCGGSSPILENVTITGNYSYHQGGGIYLISNSNPILTNVIISDNNAEGSFWSNSGGGIYCSNSNPILVNIIISGNSVSYESSDGGGIYCVENSNLNMENVSIVGNSAPDHGGGIYCSESNLNFNLENRCNLYSNIITNSRGYGLDIFADNCDVIDVIVDTFTVLTPTDHYASPIDNFTFDILNYINQQINADLYVSPDGDDTNSGLTANDPLRTIRYALTIIYADSLNQHTIYILPGIYSPSTNGEQFPLPVGNYVSLQGNNQEDTFLDAENSHDILRFGFVTEANIRDVTIRNGNCGIYISNADPCIENVTITGNSAPENGGGICCIENSYPSLVNVIITNNSASDDGGGIYCSNSILSLENITITGNSATNGGGFYFYNTNMSLENITVAGNSASEIGGGICFLNSNMSLENITITSNSADYGGGGINLSNSNPSLENVTITGNSASQNGGGIFCNHHSTPDLANVSITNNTATNGGGVYCRNYSGLNFNSENRSSIYLNNVENNRGCGADIFNNDCDTINVVVDTFSVSTPTDYYLSPIDNFTFDILHSIQDTLINSDLYVSVNGDDSNTGTTADDPLKTIKYALSKIYSDSLNQNTIYLSPGIYSSETTGETFPVEWSNYVSLEGSLEEQTILDANNESGVMRFNYVTDAEIKNIIIRNGSTDRGGGIYCANYSSPILENITIIDNSASMYGGGIYCYEYSNPSLVNVIITDNSNTGNGGGGGICCYDNSNPYLNNVTITNNSSHNGGGIYCYHSDPSLENVYITGNSADYGGGGINCLYSNPILENVSIIDNSAPKGGGIYCYHYSDPNLENVTIANNSAANHGGGIYCNHLADPYLINCIMWNNIPEQVNFSEYGYPSTITITYSDIQGGENGIVTNNTGTLYWLEGNINTNPLFADTLYHLSSASPCIDAGNPDSIYYDPEDPTNPGYALYPAMGTIINDMGAYGGPNAIGWPAVDIDDNVIVQTSEIFLLQNFPNPFNPSTSILFSIQENSKINLSAYNIKGQKVKQLISNQLLSGQHSVVWDGRDENNQPVGSGIYFYSLKVDDKIVDTKKCLLLK